MMIHWFQRMRSFGSKVTLLVTLTSGVAILAVSSALTALDYANQRREAVANLRAQTLIVAMNVGAPLAFADRRSAAEALEAFGARPSVALATVHDVHGREFASYRRAQDVAPPAARPCPRAVCFHAGSATWPRSRTAARRSAAWKWSPT